MGNLLGLKDERQLVEALMKSVQMKQTAAQILEQRVSFVVGALRPSSGVTKEQIRKELVKQGAAE